VAPDSDGGVPGRQRISSRSAIRLVALACALVSAAISAYLASQPHFLIGVHAFDGTGYDDGVYYGAADRFVHGVLPYRDFTFVQPPGAVVLFAPLGLLGRWIGSADALAVGRVLTLVVAALNAWLAAWVVRSRGLVAMAIAGLGMACFPLAVVADHSLNLEPYLIVFCLLAAVVGFSGGELASTRRILAAGVLLGVATDIKVWGAAPALALVLCALPRWRRSTVALAGWLAGLLVIALPFFAFAPSAFLHQVISAQLNRQSPVDALSIAQRFGVMFGLDDQNSSSAHSAIGAVIAIVLVASVCVGFWRWHRLISRLEWFVLAAAGAMVGGLLAASQFYDHYAYASAAFLALLVGVVVSRYLEAMDRVPRRVGWAVGAVAIVLVGVFVIPEDTSRVSSYMAGAQDISPAIDAVVPAGSCVATDYPIYLIEANRFDTARSGCTDIVDPFGMFVATEGIQPPGFTPYPPALITPWRSAFGNAQYVVLTYGIGNFVPFDPALRAMFKQKFVAVSHPPHAVVFGLRH
jgi:alpha-1,2-mannosyltransferase